MQLLPLLSFIEKHFIFSDSCTSVLLPFDRFHGPMEEEDLLLSSLLSKVCICVCFFTSTSELFQVADASNGLGIMSDCINIDLHLLCIFVYFNS